VRSIVIGILVWALAQPSWPAPRTSVAPQSKPFPTPAEIAKLPPDGRPEFNRLVFEKSPYLRQHARNPVDWFPWCDAAFEKARKEDKPVFLSVGYSTCHWCHVMEKESFEDAEVAKLLNASFVCIKVDREERPDVDQVYMAATMALTGSGGWPMTVILTPERKPFFAGTYFPKGSAAEHTGLMELLPRIVDAWKAKRKEIGEHADEVAAWIAKKEGDAPGNVLDRSTLEKAAKEFAERFDAQEGGFAVSPKFPQPHSLRFLLRWWKRTGDAHTLEMVEKTLDSMSRGGIRNHLGGGFHRYSTDRRWVVPHFEKMLYDQALIALAYVEAFEATRKDAWRQVARGTLDYVLRDLRSPEGGFFSAEDADSEGVEGKFYLWTRAEILHALGEEEGARFANAYGASEMGNVREAPGACVLHIADAAAFEGAATRRKLEESRAKLFELRARRPRPMRDEKILCDWNGLAIAALAHAARAFDAPEYAIAAKSAAEFVLAKLVDEKGRLLKRRAEGESAHAAVLDDYAFLVWGLIELYETEFDARWLAEAVRLEGAMTARFWDEEKGGFFFTANDAETLIARTKEFQDGAIPSGNSIAALDLLRLGHLTGKTAYLDRAARTMKAAAGTVAKSPSDFAETMIGVDFAVGPASEIVIAGDPSAADTQAMQRVVRSRFLPNTVVLLRPPGDDPPIARIAEFTRLQTSVGGKTTAYFCRDFACQAPVTDPSALVRSIEK
jgi:uncharacterized protein YyaL (SSP411 family)